MACRSAKKLRHGMHSRNKHGTTHRGARQDVPRKSKGGGRSKQHAKNDAGQVKSGWERDGENPTHTQNKSWSKALLDR